MSRNNQTTAIAVFVKTPGLTPLKTRLAAGIGAEKARKFYLLSLNAIQETLQALDIEPHWAVGEKQALDHPLWQQFKSLHTGEGDLGQRQHHVYQTLLKTHKKVLLIGADAPQISVSILQQAIDALENNDFVIGPAYDGGYYLFGGRCSTELKVWTAVPWSTAETRQELELALSSKPHHLNFLHDVDEASDLKYLEAEMPAVLNNPQKNLVDWVLTVTR